MIILQFKIQLDLLQMLQDASHFCLAANATGYLTFLFGC